ncbi:hypothetical protein NDU88_000169 [Pleurodeles waltl]|uniref:Uncharacterized protein n=1 Tax=Pleurodeles waltl TaxID=8319 RepID=A0AAV7V883_PLEWA|nr:hypothetical protein NDU88_000169 [Pleurodeles waltl]
MGLLTSRSAGNTAAWSSLAFLGYGAPGLWGALLADLLELELLELPGLCGSLLADLLELQLLGAAWPSWVMVLLSSRSAGNTAAWSSLAFLGYGAPWLWGSLVTGCLTSRSTEGHRGLGSLENQGMDLASSVSCF